MSPCFQNLIGNSNRTLKLTDFHSSLLLICYILILKLERCEYYQREKSLSRRVTEMWLIAY